MKVMGGKNNGRNGVWSKPEITDHSPNRLGDYSGLGILLSRLSHVIPSSSRSEPSFAIASNPIMASWRFSLGGFSVADHLACVTNQDIYFADCESYNLVDRSERKSHVQVGPVCGVDEFRPACTLAMSHRTLRIILDQNIHTPKRCQRGFASVMKMQVSKSREISGGDCAAMLTWGQPRLPMIRPTSSVNSHVNLCRPFLTSRGRLDTTITNQPAVNSIVSAIWGCSAMWNAESATYHWRSFDLDTCSSTTYKTMALPPSSISSTPSSRADNRSKPKTCSKFELISQ